MTNIGFIGLGHMGAPMAHNLVRHQQNVFVYDINQQAIDKLVADGAKQVSSLMELCQQVDIIITMLPMGRDVKAVYSGDEGILQYAKKNTLLIDSSTISVNEARALHQAALEAGISMVDAPVSGGVAAATAGTLTFMVGGDEYDFHHAKTILTYMGKAVIHAGPIGNGQAAKLCNNMILGISMIAISEAFVLGQKLGLDPKKLYEISSQSSGQCWSMTSYCPVPDILPNVPSNNHFQPGFTAAMMLKDLLISQQAAQNVGAATPLGAEATALYALFNNQGNGALDFSGIIRLIEGKHS